MCQLSQKGKKVSVIKPETGYDKSPYIGRQRDQGFDSESRINLVLMTFN